MRQRINMRRSQSRHIFMLCHIDATGITEHHPDFNSGHSMAWRGRYVYVLHPLPDDKIMGEIRYWRGRQGSFL